MGALNDLPYYLIPCEDLDNVILGESNGDGMVNINDVTLIQEYNVELEALSDRQQKLADYNGDGIIDITDATAIQLYIAS